VVCQICIRLNHLGMPRTSSKRAEPIADQALLVVGATGIEPVNSVVWRSLVAISPACGTGPSGRWALCSRVSASHRFSVILNVVWTRCGREDRPRVRWVV